MRVVLDTNVFVSALFWRGYPFIVLNLCLELEVQLVVSEDILQEVIKILTEERKFELTQEEVEIYSEILRNSVEVVTPVQKLKVVKEDPTDDKFIECALAGEADYIISGDKHLLGLKEYEDIKILTSAEFLRILHRKI